MDSINGEPQHRPRYTMILVLRTLENGPLISGKPKLRSHAMVHRALACAQVFGGLYFQIGQKHLSPTRTGCVAVAMTLHVELWNKSSELEIEILCQRLAFAPPSLAASTRSGMCTEINGAFPSPASLPAQAAYDKYFRETAHETAHPGSPSIK